MSNLPKDLHMYANAGCRMIKPLGDIDAIFDDLVKKLDRGEVIVAISFDEAVIISDEDHYNSFVYKKTVTCLATTIKRLERLSTNPEDFAQEIHHLLNCGRLRYIKR